MRKKDVPIRCSNNRRNQYIRWNDRHGRHGGSVHLQGMGNENRRYRIVDDTINNAIHGNNGTTTTHLWKQLFFELFLFI